jgi:hypothetical protein
MNIERLPNTDNTDEAFEPIVNSDGDIVTRDDVSLRDVNIDLLPTAEQFAKKNNAMEKLESAMSAVAIKLEEEPSGCECRCFSCDNGGGIHCSKQSSGCYI